MDMCRCRSIWETSVLGRLHGKGYPFARNLQNIWHIIIILNHLWRSGRSDPLAQNWILAGFSPASTLTIHDKPNSKPCASATARQQAYSIMQETLARPTVTATISHGSAHLTPPNTPQPCACNGSTDAPGRNRTRASA
jgi:hypothetical protein